MRLEYEASDKTYALSARCLDYTKETSSIHSEKVAEISRIARKSLLDDYLVRKIRADCPNNEHRTLTSSILHLLKRLSRLSFLEQVDSSDLSPWKRNFSLPSEEDIEGLIRCSFGELLESSQTDKVAA